MLRSPARAKYSAAKMARAQSSKRPKGEAGGLGCFIAAGALVKEHAVIPERSLVAGVPGVVKRTFTEEELQRQKKNAAVYTDDASEYANNVKIVG